MLRSAELQGWRIEKRPRGYFKMYCPCAEKHLKTVHLTPGHAYLQNLRGWLGRTPCWKGDM